MGTRGHAAPDAPATPARASRFTGSLRLLAILVLLGLWLMHGVSATTGAGCHGVPVMMTMSASDTGHGSTMAGDAAPRAGRGAVSRSGDVDTAHVDNARADTARAESADTMRSGSGETCLSGQPPSPRDLLISLLGCFALAILACGMAARPMRAPSSRPACRDRRRGPPGHPVGRALLTTVCVSRT